MSELQAVSPPSWVSQLQSPLPAKTKPSSIPDPPGFSGSSGNKLTEAATSKKGGKDAKDKPRKQPTNEEMDTLKLKKAWEVALAPIKALPMTAIMMYMSGNSLQIFSIMMVFMAFKNPLMGLVNTNEAFERFQNESNSGQMIQAKLAYVACQLVALAVGIWKINGMGLLPTTTSDWLMWELQRESVDRSSVAF